MIFCTGKKVSISCRFHGGARNEIAEILVSRAESLEKDEKSQRETPLDGIQKKKKDSISPSSGSRRRTAEERQL
jgi:hypothetical protein